MRITGWVKDNQGVSFEFLPGPSYPRIKYLGASYDLDPSRTEIGPLTKITSWVKPSDGQRSQFRIECHRKYTSGAEPFDGESFIFDLHYYWAGGGGAANIHNSRTQNPHLAELCDFIDNAVKQGHKLFLVKSGISVDQAPFHLTFAADTGTERKVYVWPALT